MWKQFIDFMVGLFTFNFGQSMWTGQPIVHEIELRFALSLRYHGYNSKCPRAIPWHDFCRPPKYLVGLYSTWFSIAGIAMPSFWLGILIILGLLIYTQAWFGALDAAHPICLHYRRSTW